MVCPEWDHVRSACFVLVLVIIQRFLKMFSKTFTLTNPCYVTYCTCNNLNTEKKHTKLICLRGGVYQGMTHSLEDDIQPCELRVYFRTLKNKAKPSLLALTGLKGQMGATIPDPGHFALSWEQTFIWSPPIIQMATKTMIIIMKMTVDILKSIVDLPCCANICYTAQ